MFMYIIFTLSFLIQHNTCINTLFFLEFQGQKRRRLLTIAKRQLIWHDYSAADVNHLKNISTAQFCQATSWTWRPYLLDATKRKGEKK